MLIDLEQAIDRFRLNIRRALHVGAHHGEEDEAYRKLGIEPVYVEANPDAFRVLSHALPDRRRYNVAVSDHVGTCTLHVTSFDQSSSILPLARHREVYPDIVEVATIDVPCTTIDDLVADAGGAFDLLNMDIQGAELMALRGAGRLLPTLAAVMTEVNRQEMYAGCGLLRDMDRFLGGFGFRRAVSDFRYHRSWGDALYLPASRVPDGLLKRSARRLAGLFR
jgi:FkbM family methyltransferase